MYKSTKIIDGFSATFRQWKATHSHCQFLHGYALSFKIVFESETLDKNNWVLDFGFAKRFKMQEDNQTISEWFKQTFDHTTIIASDDPYLKTFYELKVAGLIQLVVLPNVGCEAFAKFIYDIINPIIIKETAGQVKIKSVECIEHSKNSAIYSI